jgi:hypothetical protein
MLARNNKNNKEEYRFLKNGANLWNLLKIVNWRKESVTLARVGTGVEICVVVVKLDSW